MWIKFGLWGLGDWDTAHGLGFSPSTEAVGSKYSTVVLLYIDYVRSLASSPIQQPLDHLLNVMQHRPRTCSLASSCNLAAGDDARQKNLKHLSIK